MPQDNIHPDTQAMIEGLKQEAHDNALAYAKKEAADFLRTFGLPLPSLAEAALMKGYLAGYERVIVAYARVKLLERAKTTGNPEDN